MKTSATLILAISTCLSGCATMSRPNNAPQSLYASQQVSPHAGRGAAKCTPSASPVTLDTARYVPAQSLATAPDQLSQGDRIRLVVAGDKDQLTGNYVVAADGTILLLGRIRIDAVGLTVPQLERAIAARLFSERLIRGTVNGIKLDQIELGGVPVAVAGAVFESGTVRVGERQAEIRSLNISNIVAGDQNAGRMLSTALRAAGGIRPDADVRNIILTRAGHWTRLDLSGALDGQSFTDLHIAAGDRIFVPSMGCLQEHLVRPSVITAPGIRVHMSNLSRPAASNAASAIGKETVSLPYGTRFLQGLVSANCVGGSAMNAGRSAVLISRNPVTGQSIVISRSVERLVRQADRDSYDPYLMPGDAIACYDSTAMNLRDVVSTVSEAVTPYVLFKNVD